MGKFLLQRFIRAVITIWFVVTLVFFVLRSVGDPITAITISDGLDEAAMRNLRTQLGLDKPILEQYFETMTSLFDKTDIYYRSYRHMRPVQDLFAERAGATVKLGLLSLFIAVAFSIPLGVTAAIKRNTVFDRISMVLSILGSVIPNFVLGLLLIFLFAMLLRLLPSGGATSWRHFILPAIAMAVGPMATIARLTRSSMLDVLRQDYLDFARAKGLPERQVVIRHGLRNALIPVVTIVGLQFGYIVGGSIIVETVFSWPGIGFLIVEAARRQDFPIIQFGVMLIATAIALANMIVDILYAVLDPKIREKM